MAYEGVKLGRSYFQIHNQHGQKHFVNYLLRKFRWTIFLPLHVFFFIFFTTKMVEIGCRG